MTKLIFSTIALSTLLFSCQPEGRIYTDHQHLSPNVEWLKKDIRTFEIPIESTDKKYDLGISFRYAQGFPYKFAKVHVIETAPNGTKTQHDFNLQVRNEDGSFIGDAGGDIWDSEHVVIPSKTFDQKGIYLYEISHSMANDPMNFAMEIGMTLDEIKN